MLFDFEMIQKFYQTFPDKLTRIRKAVGRPLTFTEKILYTHFIKEPDVASERGNRFVELLPDRVAMHGTMAQAALLQFVSSKKSKTAVPATVHCERLNLAALQGTDQGSKELIDFLQSTSQTYGINCWNPETGTMQVLQENYAFPGGLLMGAGLSPSSNGSLGMLAFEANSASAADVLAGIPWKLCFPKIIGVKLTGKLKAAPKGVILELSRLLKSKVSANTVIEYFGEGTESISNADKGMICDMGGELGAVSSLFPYGYEMSDYLKSTGREEISKIADGLQYHLQPHPEVLEHPDDYYDQTFEIYLSDL